MATLAPSRQRISDDFLDDRRRERILHGLAITVAESDYTSCHINTIVRAARCARKTFYEMYGGKADAAQALLAHVCPALGERFVGVDPARNSLSLLAVEVAAAWEAGDRDSASEKLVAGERIMRGLANASLNELAPDGDAQRCTLPPGRHGLSRDFIRENQRQRLLVGLTAAITAAGLPRTTIADVASHAAVSRQTFYEQFDSMEEAARALVAFASDFGAELLEGVGLRSGLGGVGVELIAARLSGDQDASIAKIADIEVVFRALKTTFGPEDGR